MDKGRGGEVGGRERRGVLGWISSNPLEAGDTGARLARVSKELRKKYKVERLIERGGYGDVWLCTDRSSHSKVACKVLNKPVATRSKLSGQPPSSWKEKVASRQRASIDREVAALRKLSELRHPGIVRLLEVHESKTQTDLVMEFCVSGDLHEHILSRGPMLEDQARALFQQLASAVAFCHSRGILHRDIKAENVLLMPASREGHHQAKLCDFGLAVSMEEGGQVADAGGSQYWMAPEVTRGETYGSKADVWGLGLVLFAMLTGNLPKNPQRMKEAPAIWRGLYNNPIDLSFLNQTHFPKELQDLLRSILEFNPKLRLDSHEVLRHPWVAGVGGSGKGVKGIAKSQTLPLGLSGWSSTDSLLGGIKVCDSMSSMCSSPFSMASPQSKQVFTPRQGWEKEIMEEE